MKITNYLKAGVLLGILLSNPVFSQKNESSNSQVKKYSFHHTNGIRNISQDIIKTRLLNGKDILLSQIQGNEQLQTKKLIDSEKIDFISVIQHSDKQLNTKYERYQQYYDGLEVAFVLPTVHYKNGNPTVISGDLYAIQDLSIKPKKAAVEAESFALQALIDQGYSEVIRSGDSELLIFPELERAENKATSITLAYRTVISAIEPLSSAPFLFDIYVNAANGEILLINSQTKSCFHLESDSKEGSHDCQAHSSSNSNSNSLLSPPPPSLIPTHSTLAATRYNGLQTIRTRRIGTAYYLLSNDEARVENANGTQSAKFDYRDTDNNWTAAEYDNANKANSALSAFWGITETFDYFKNVHHRNGFNGLGLKPLTLTNVGVNYKDASYTRTSSGSSIVRIGNGDYDPVTGTGTVDALSSLDVMAHEFTHGMTAFTSDLIYQGESGALNEGFSDIFAAAIEDYVNDDGSFIHPNAWLIGEQIAYNGSGGHSAFRSMNNPIVFGDPYTYLGTNWVPTTTAADFGGVHTNSGVLNYCFYLLASGGSGINDNSFSYNVAGIGMEKAAKIAFRALRVYLSPNSNYLGALQAFKSAATDLYGSGSTEVTSTIAAFEAVGLEIGPGGGPIVQIDYATPSGYCENFDLSTTYEYVDRLILTDANGAYEYVPQYPHGLPHSGDDGGYGDFIGSFPDALAAPYTAPTLEPGSTYQAWIYAGFPGATYTEKFVLWIDLNRDGDFYEPDERLVFTVEQGWAVFENFTIPSNALSGATRMRVGVIYESDVYLPSVAAPDPCKNTGWGEFEDYIVLIGGSNMPPSGIVHESTSNESDALDPERQRILNERSIPSENLSIKIYPNPVEDKLFFELDDKNIIVSGYEVYSITGGKTLITENQLKDNSVDVSDLDRGTYILNVITNTGKILGQIFIK